MSDDELRPLLNEHNRHVSRAIDGEGISHVHAPIPEDEQKLCNNAVGERLS